MPNPLRDATAADMLRWAAGRWPEREAIVAADRRIDYARFLGETERQ